ncbi:TIM barrel protein [Pelosinus propionicus]|uniref:Deoxyribonuclease-4 n=1 Tax=Pelosinus propionicus DSM 13327 TaxID=1123291 RepID=A0A1I4MVY4_9FIRM|nr:TIM barrel protein [Pelosinus propionicus]SFM07150.1 deoxyribonuclease-4 [Pelosinus propionicus DSM 13327]
MLAQFGPGGNPDAFYAAGYKASVEMPAWLDTLKLTAYEYQCTRGVNIKEETAIKIGQQAVKYGVKLSIHAPYYINLSTDDEKVIGNTQNHFIKSLEVARWMGADRIVFHMGGVGKQDRKAALEKVKHALFNVLELIEQRGLTGVYLCPETMGKQNQLGSLEEVLSVCTLSEWLIPTVDFGHLHAVTAGKYTTEKEFEAVFDKVGETLGMEVAKKLHVHFSPIEFTKGGEKRHWTFADEFGPPYEPFVAVCSKRGFTPRVICESAGTQAADAKTMQDFYVSLLKQK